MYSSSQNPICAIIVRMIRAHAFHIHLERLMDRDVFWAYARTGISILDAVQLV